MRGTTETTRKACVKIYPVKKSPKLILVSRKKNSNPQEVDEF